MLSVEYLSSIQKALKEYISKKENISENQLICESFLKCKFHTKSFFNQNKRVRQDDYFIAQINGVNKIFYLKIEYRRYNENELNVYYTISNIRDI